MKRSRTILFLVLVLALCLQALPAAVFAQQGEAQEEVAPAFVPGQIIISFQPGLGEEEIAAFYQEYNLTQMDNLDPSAPDEGRLLALAFVPADVTPSLLDNVARDSRVRYAEPNYILQVNKTPDDPEWESLWGLNNTGQTGGKVDADIDALEGWEVTTGSANVIVAVIDTGIDYTHEDLAGNIWVNPGECPGGVCEANGIDDDGNGYIDDFHGINAITDSGDPMDDFGHGTHVAGTIGAKGNNATGVTGVNWDVKIIGCKFLGASGGGSVAGAVKCFNYIHQLKNEQGQNIIATNNSWGGGAPSQALEEAMAGPNQPLHVCAAGNGGTDAPHYPAAYDLENIISVAATDHSDLYAGFSNYGDTVDLAAPGVDILSTVPTGNCALCDPSGYGEIGGTSMAAPHVTGAAALIAAQFPSLTPVQIKQRILTGIDPLTDESKSTATNGRLNVLNTLEEDEVPPAAISDLSAVKFLLTQVELTWTAVGDDGLAGRANAYDVRYSTTPISPDNWNSAERATGAPKPKPAGQQERFVVSGLEPDTTYYFALKAVDNVGNESDLSNVVAGKTSAGTIVFEDDMESGPGEWTVTGKDALWHLSEHRANSPTHAWYYGDEESRTYDTGGANNGMLTSPPIALSTNEDVLLTFHEWSELEAGVTYDRTRVQVSADEGETWETVFESHGTNDLWLKRSVSLTPYVGESSTIQVRFWFDTIDNRFNNFEGWYVDDVKVLVAKPSLPGAGPDLPNLFIQEANIGFSNANPQTGDSVTISALVVNNGAVDVDEVRVQFMDAGPAGQNDESATTPIGPPQTIAGIPAGSNGTAEVVLETAGMTGERTIQVVVDPFNLIAEANESDNEASRTLMVQAPPAANLTVSEANISFVPAKPQPGEQVSVRAVVINNGAIAANGILVRFVDVTESGSSTPIDEAQTIDTLAPGQSAVVAVTYDTSGPAANRRIKVVIDPQNAVPESDEKDNEATATLELVKPPLPNLIVRTDDVGMAPAKPTAGEVVTVSATIRNDGAVAAANVAVQFTDVTNSASLPIGEVQIIDLIPPGASGMAQVAYPTANLSGDRKLRVTADPQNFIAEASETDNEATVTLSIAPAPIANLVMASANIGFASASRQGAGALHPVAGEAVTVRAVVLNAGAADAENVAVQFFDATGGDLSPIGAQQRLRLIPAGGSAVVETVYQTIGLAGERTIQVSVDPNNFVPESNKEDNTATRTLRIAPPGAANLTMTPANIVFAPPAPAEGDVVTLTAVVLNTGATDAANVLVQFVDVTNGAFTPIGAEQTIAAIAPGQSAAAQTVYDTSGKAGARRILVLVDSNNLVPESDETDNEAQTTLRVASAALANLTVGESDIGFSPLQPVEGDKVRLTVTVHNRGDVAAENVLVQILDASEGESLPVGEMLRIETLAAGDAAVVETFYDTAGKTGERRLRIVIDPGNAVAESDETDNRTAATLVVKSQPAPNLVVQNGNIGIHPADPVQGDAVTLTVTIVNNGSAPAEDVLVQFVDITGGAAEPIGLKQTLERIDAGQSATAQVVYDTTGKSGERRIRVAVDPHQTIVETSEADNEAAAAVTVAPPPLPNLVALEQNIGFNPAAAKPGDEVQITATILNNGGDDATDVAVQFFDATGNSSMPIGETQVISTIPAGASGVAQIAYNTAGRTGERKIQVVADPNNLLRESDENDNRAVATLVVQPPPIANLVIRATGIGFDPSEVTNQSTVEIYATVRNAGTAAARSVVVQFLDVTGGGSNLIGEPQTLEAIGPGSSAVARVTYDVAAFTGGAAGDRKVQVVVDPTNSVPESSESDNEATATLPVAKPPIANLAITSGNISFSDPAPVEGESVTIFAVVRNTGSADASGVQVQFSEVTTNTKKAIGPQQVIPSIPAGGSAVAQALFDTSGQTGEREIEVTVDPNAFIPEEKTSDNTAKRTLTISPAPRPNLTALASNMGFSPLAPTEGASVAVRVAVFNHGQVEARDIVVQVLDVTGGSAVPVGAPQTIARLVPGASATVQFSFDTTGKQGDRTLQATIDPNNFIAESDETDNVAMKSLFVAPPPAPNLVALSSNVEFDPPDPNEGDLVTVRATVLNNGTAAATDVVVVLADITDGEPEVIGQPRLLDSVLPGESGMVQVAYDSTGKEGERRIQFTVDPNNTIQETDENDNVAVARLIVAPPPAPNLVMKADNIAFTPPAPTEGTEVKIIATVLNQGALDAGTVEVQFLDVTNGGETPIGSIQKIAGIAAGGSGRAEVAFDTEGKVGERTLRVVVDPNGLIDEMDETDNQAEKSLTVSPPEEIPVELPNLTVISDTFTFDPPAPQPGDQVTVTITVSNTGEADASNVVVRFVDATADEPEPIGEDQTIPSVESGEGETVSVVYDTTDKSGERLIRVIVDPDGAIEESDETDNEAETTLVVGGETEGEAQRPSLTALTSEATVAPAEDGGVETAAMPPPR